MMSFLKKTYRLLLLLAIIMTSNIALAQRVDVMRGLAWKNYGDAVARKMIEQEGMQITISGNHIYMNEENGKIVDIQNEMNNYLNQFHDQLKLAAMCYSLYYECKTVVENVQSINKSIGENPEGIICAAVVDERGKTYLRLFSQTLALINDVYQIFANKNDEARYPMNEKERIWQLDVIRKKLKKINTELNMLATYIKYTNMNDLLNRILRTHYTFHTRTRQKIARDCLIQWRDHYSTESIFLKR